MNRNIYIVNHISHKKVAVLMAMVGILTLGCIHNAFADKLSNQSTISDAQQKSVIKGYIKDKTTGHPLVGVAVANEVTHVGTVSDSEGHFSVVATPGESIYFSYLGYQPIRQKVPFSGIMTIYMEEDSQLVNDVVVVGYSTQRKINVTGAVSSISGEEIAQRPVVSTMQALQGVDPSLNIIMSSGNPTDGNSLNIRGVPSINGGEPLILVDGVPGVALRMVNAADIESISVLKDASASAIYGAKASAGVILITTKSGGSDKVKVNYNNNIGWTQPTVEHDFITNGYEYATMIDNLYTSRYGYSAFNYTEQDWAELEARRYDKKENPERPWVVVGDDGKYHYYGNFDWYHNIYNTNRFHHEHNLSISGGTKNVNYYVSGRLYSQEGLLSGAMLPTKERFENTSFRAKFDAKIFKWAKWSTNVSLNSNYQIYPGTLNEAQTFGALEQNVTPMFVPYNPDGTIVMYPADLRNLAIGTGRTASLADGNNVHKINNQTLTISNGLQLQLTKDLTFDAAYNINQYDRLYRDRTHDQVYSSSIGETKTATNYQKDEYRERSYKYNLNNVDAYFTYTHTWNQSHNFKALLGMNYEHYRSTDLTVDQYGTGSELLSTFNSVNDDTYYKISQDISAYQTLGFFARVNYDFAGKYLFEASIRADGTSRFAKKDRWGYFPSASAGWRFTEEDFMNGVRHWWDNGKIRFSYGALGNQQVSNYLYIDRITTGTLSYAFDDSSVVKYSSVTNPLATDLTWETVYTYNWGLDLSFLRNRLSFTGDYFIRDTKDMLTTSLTLPDAYGASTPKGNCANLRTKGWEVSISWKDQFSLAGKPFHYGITGQIGDYQTTITKYNNPTKIFSDYYEGKKIGEIWGYHVVGLFKSDEEAAAYQKAINNSTNVYQRIYNMKPTGLGQLMAGDVQFEDTDNSGSIGVGSGTVDDPGDMRIIGNTTPRYGYSFRLEASWNGLDISAFFQGVGKRDWYPTANNDGIWGSNMFWQLYSYPIVSFVAKDFMKNVWTEDNTDAYFPRLRPIICYNGGPLGQNNDRYLQDISYLRFKNLTIGYTLPVLTKHISKIRIYVSGENLYYWSPLKKYNKNIDPELAGSTGTYTSGSGTGYLMPKIYSFGVDLTF